MSTTTRTMTRPTFDAPPADDAGTRERVWARVQLARNVRRPHTLELLGLMAEDVIELHGDRVFGDDAALVGGFATLGGRRILFLGHQKGGEVEENIRRNFGMPHPDGYRKAMRLMRLAERLGLPVITFVDTPGASPDAASEERGQAEAIASSIALMTRLRVPIVTIITGEGGSGGALAIAVGDVVLALENAIYSVISPEGCASILWRTPEAAQQAAVAMRLTAADQLALGVVDEVVPEPAAGAHEDPEQTARAVREVLVRHLERLVDRDPADLVEARYRRYRQIGSVQLVGPVVRTPRPRKGVGDRLRELLAPARPARPDGDLDASAVARTAPSRPSGDDADIDTQPPLHEEI
ncbi:MAG: acetyl-CoA carboxylase carboxyltransferase subunit alpha [Chloroflexi bacterium]|nr:acetyl-CoA carboxylase carboxyltransferase subunit alpha [Chloroflexota bacterium]